MKGVYGDYIGISIGIHLPALPEAPVRIGRPHWRRKKVEITNCKPRWSVPSVQDVGILDVGLTFSSGVGVSSFLVVEPKHT